MNCLLMGTSGKQTNSRFLPVALLAVLLVAGACTQAFAQCGTPKRFVTAAASKVEPNTFASMGAAQLPVPSLNRQEHDRSREPIVGLWRIVATDDAGNIVDRVISGWTSDGLEFDQDISPILTGYVCYGTWVKLGKNKYGLTHPFFTFQDVNTNNEGSESTEGQWDGNSAYFDYRVKVDKEGETFAGKMLLKIVQGPDPYDPNATVLFTATFNLSATKLEVDRSLLP